ncbi:MAG: 2-hydroxyacyl-CoA dehydratase family protein [Candidatus Bathyarchaeota archaeon]|nr:2-hydroxyacyl-CoA dehydratase family protein [Candidatus Bathyarchaeota archaeon]
MEWNAGQREILNRIEREYGIPGVIIEADMVDPRFFNDAQIELRLQALFEMIDARRKR